MTEDHVAALDKRGESWNLYRAHDNRWIVQMGGPPREDPSHRSVSAATIEEALAAACASLRLPVIPPRPSRFWASDVKFRKDGSGWFMDTGTGTCRVPSKKRGAEIAAQREQYSIEQGAAWDQQFGEAVRVGKPGIDFNWAR